MVLCQIVDGVRSLAGRISPPILAKSSGNCPVVILYIGARDFHSLKQNKSKNILYTLHKVLYIMHYS